MTARQPLRILYSHRIGSRDGQGVHLEALVAALRADGHTLHVVGPAGFDRARLGGDNRAVALLRRSMPGWVGELAELAYALPATWRLDRAAAEFRPDVIYERANLFHFAGTLVAWRRGLPLLLEVNAPLAAERGRFGGLALRRLAAAGERLVWHSASRLLPVTGVLGEMLAAAGVPRGRIAVVPNGIDPADFPAPDPRPAGQELVLGFVGFMRDWHGLDAVIRGIAGWTGTPRLVLHLVGEGPARPGLEKMAAGLGIADRVRFTGIAPRAAIPALVAGFDIALQPAAVAYASPLKLFEYMAAGRAILAPDQPNLREVLAHGQTGWLFAPGQMWQGALALAQDAPLRARLGAAARADLLRRGLTWSGNAARVAAIAAEEGAPRHPAPPAGATLEPVA